jgi:hypothetical protein
MSEVGPPRVDAEPEEQPMDEQVIREHAQALCDALVAGDVDRAIEDFSKELRQNLGEVISMLPLPSSEATIESIEHAGAGYNVVLRLVGETDEVVLQTRWKDRDGQATVVEASHLSKTAVAAADAEIEGAAEADEAG